MHTHTLSYTPTNHETSQIFTNTHTDRVHTNTHNRSHTYAYAHGYAMGATAVNTVLLRGLRAHHHSPLLTIPRSDAGR
jgi:hypothetical protein